MLIAAQFVLLGIAALFFSVVLRTAGMRHPAIPAGALAGVLLGPLVLGRTWPEAHRALFEGGLAERAALVELAEQQQAAMFALQKTGVSEDAIVQQREAHEAEAAPLREAFEKARGEHRRASALGIGLVAAVALSLCVRRGRMFRPDSAAAFVTAWTSVVVVGGVGLIAVYLMGEPRTGAIVTGLAFAIPAGLRLTWRTPMREEVDAAEGPLRTVSSLSGTGMWLALAAAVGAAGYGQEWPAWTALGGCAIAGLWAAQRARGHLLRAWMMSAIIMLLIPTAVAAVVCRLELTGTEALAAVLLGGIVGGDGRWLGAASGLRWLGMPWGSGFRLAAPLTDPMHVQAGIAAAAWGSELISGQAAAACFVAAWVCDVTLRLRISLTHRLSEAGTEDDSPGQ